MVKTESPPSEKVPMDNSNSRILLDFRHKAAACKPTFRSNSAPQTFSSGYSVNYVQQIALFVCWVSLSVCVNGYYSIVQAQMGPKRCPLYGVAGCPQFKCIEVYGEAIGTF